MKYAALTALGITVIFAFVWIGKNPARPPAFPTPSPTSFPNLSTYTNSNYGIRFQYPSAWVITENPQGGNLVTASGNQISFYFTPDTSSTLADYLTRLDSLSQTAYEGQPSRRVASSGALLMDNLDCIQRQEYLTAADITQTITYCRHGSVVTAIALVPVPGNTVVQDMALYRQLLSSLRFFAE